MFCLGLFVRLLFVALFPGTPYYSGISGEYLDAAKNLLHGHGLTAYVDVASYSSHQVHFEYLPFIGRPVGYVAYFCLIALVTGIQPVAFQIGQAIITAFSVVLVYKLTLALFRGNSLSERLAEAAAILAALWPNEARFEVALLPDGITTLVMLGLALELTRFVQSGKAKHLLTSSGILALSIYLRPDLVLLPIFLLPAFFFVIPVKKSIISFAILCVMLGAAIGINTWKNYAISGEIVPLNLGSGTTMYEGISQFGDTLGTTYADERVSHNKLDTKQLFYPDGKKHDSALFAEAVDTIKHHPWFYTTVVLRRIPLLFTVRGLYFNDSVSFSNPNDDLSKRFPGKYVAMFRDHPLAVTLRFLSPLIGWLLLLAAAFGFIRAWKISWKDQYAVAILLFYFIATHLMTNVEPRYFYPAIPLLYPYAVYALRRKKADTKLPVN